MGKLTLAACIISILGFIQPFRKNIEAGSKKSNSLRIFWKDNLLTISDDTLSGKKIEILYLEAFCKTNSTNQNWEETTIPHKTELVFADEKNTHIKLRTLVEPDIKVTHDIRVKKDEVAFNLVLQNKGKKRRDIEWFQPCIHVDNFTNRNQENYTSRCFIFTKSGLTTLNKTQHTEEAIYKGGQVYAPQGINLNDVNPRPLSPDKPINGLIGCFSDDDKYLMATAWDNYQELFQGIFVCIHSDPRIGGLKAGEVKKVSGKIYFLKNDPEKLLQRYHRDFSKTK